MNSVSSKVVIDRIFRDFRPQGSSWVADVPEMIGEAMALIGFHCGFSQKSKKLIIKNHIATIEEGVMENLEFVEYNGKRLPSSSTMIMYDIPRISNESTQEDEDEDILKELKEYIEKYENIEEALVNDPLNEDFLNKRDLYSKRVRELTKYIKTKPIKKSSHSDSYYYDTPIFTTSFPEGIVYVHYLWVKEKDGYPMIPNEPLYQEAVFFYVISRILMSGEKHPVFNYTTAYQQWMSYRNQASNKGKMENYVDQMDKLVNMFSTYNFDTTVYESFK